LVAVLVLQRACAVHIGAGATVCVDCHQAISDVCIAGTDFISVVVASFGDFSPIGRGCEKACA
jgi:hypothetical protein